MFAIEGGRLSHNDRAERLALLQLATTMVDKRRHRLARIERALSRTIDLATSARADLNAAIALTCDAARAVAIADPVSSRVEAEW